MRLLIIHACLLSSIFSVSILSAQTIEIPRQHDRPPGPPTAPEEALKKFTVPSGFHMELVAAEPDLVNPVAMTIDEKGRYWVTESLEYPRMSAGPGQDRIKVLEDTNNDGKVDKVTIFAEGLNIPSGIAVGYGGVWVANSPDLLFIEDTDGDLKADKTTKLVTGFGRTDTHELPSAFTWGPDGWLYGLNGVFNYSDVDYTPQNPNYREDHPGWKFTCALWRIHPRTKEFQIYAEGTSNPWGVAINNEGDFFFSACVIDHLWHITEGAYYIRQGGPYPPNTWPLRSIVEHKHQKAAYCGITYYDSDAYPKEYRNVLYMGNIHGNCLNSDTVAEKGSSYFGSIKPDLISANDAWFMPVAQQTGPDGNLYVLDWYDQYHCYQDANADPAGVERAKGRLYRLVYDGKDSSAKKTRQAPRDISSLDTTKLVGLLASENGFERWTAQRLLAERSDATSIMLLKNIVLDTKTNERTKMHALWTLGSMKQSPELSAAIWNIAKSPSDKTAPWTMRFLGEIANEGHKEAQDYVGKLSVDNKTLGNPRITLATIPVVAKQKHLSPKRKVQVIAGIALRHPEDETIQHVAYNYLRSAADDSEAFNELIAIYNGSNNLGSYAVEWGPRLLAWSQSAKVVKESQTAQLANVFLSNSNEELEAETLGWLHDRLLSTNEPKLAAAVTTECLAKVKELAKQDNGVIATGATLVLATLKDQASLDKIEQFAMADDTDIENRIAAIRTIIAAKPERISDIVAKTLVNSKISTDDRSDIIDALGASRNDDMAQWLAGNYKKLEPEFQPKLIELLSQRPTWAKPLLEKVAAGDIPTERFNLNQLRRLSSFKDEGLQQQITKLFGSVRQNNSQERGGVVNRMRDMLGGMKGDPFAGRAVFKRVCSQCHVLHGDGANVGPDITRNGRNNWYQLIQNVFDPSAVIGPGFQAVIVLTDEGRVLTGVPTEETEQAITLKIQGGKIETISKENIEEIKRSDVSLMPEQIENQMNSQEIADLFAYLALDKPPEDASAVQLSGAPAQQIREKAKP